MTIHFGAFWSVYFIRSLNESFSFLYFLKNKSVTAIPVWNGTLWTIYAIVTMNWHFDKRCIVVGVFFFSGEKRMYENINGFHILSVVVKNYGNELNDGVVNVIWSQFYNNNDKKNVTVPPINSYILSHAIPVKNDPIFAFICFACKSNIVDLSEYRFFSN